MRHAVCHAAVLVTTSIATGCGPLLGIDDWSPPATTADASATHTGGSSSTASSDGAGGTSAGGSASGGADGGGGTLCVSPDCASPDCLAAGFACEPAAPVGWAGPAMLYDGPPASRPVCGDGAEDVFDGGHDPIQDAAACSACACAPGITCALGMLASSATTSCGAPEPLIQTGGCIAGNPSAVSYQAEHPTYESGGCTPSGGAPSVPPPAWSAVGRICQPVGVGAGCSAGEVCLSPPPSPFVGPCIWQSGAAPCPAPWIESHALFTSFVDDRGCTACGCGSPECSATTHLYASPNCSGAPAADIPNDDACHPGPGVVTSNASVVGACPSTGGLPTGTLAAGPAAITVCCKP